MRAPVNGQQVPFKSYSKINAVGVLLTITKEALQILADRKPHSAYTPSGFSDHLSGEGQIELSGQGQIRLTERYKQNVTTTKPHGPTGAFLCVISATYANGQVSLQLGYRKTRCYVTPEHEA